MRNSTAMLAAGFLVMSLEAACDGSGSSPDAGPDANSVYDAGPPDAGPPDAGPDHPVITCGATSAVNYPDGGYAVRVQAQTAIYEALVVTGTYCTRLQAVTFTAPAWAVKCADWTHDDSADGFAAQDLSWQFVVGDAAYYANGFLLDEVRLGDGADGGELLGGNLGPGDLVVDSPPFPSFPGEGMAQTKCRTGFTLDP